MRVVVPLAGPDFVRSDGSLKAEIDLNGEPLLWRVLNSRPWAGDVKEYSFILADKPETRKFASNSLTVWYPKSVITFVSDNTCGAALSALAGMATSKSVDDPVIVDLADILYSSTLEPTKTLQKHANCGGIALVFKSNNPAYSYLSLDTSGSFEEAVEKQVISDNASAGTYIFRNMATYLRALAYCLENQESQTFRDLFFVCPVLNGVKDQSKCVLLDSVADVVDIKLEEI
jgi:hypothetical protein